MMRAISNLVRGKRAGRNRVVLSREEKVTRHQKTVDWCLKSWKQAGSSLFHLDGGGQESRTDLRSPRFGLVGHIRSRHYQL